MKLQHLPEPSLQFGETPPFEVSDPRYGITKFGPFDFTQQRQFDSITALAIGPKSQKEKFQILWNSLTNGVTQRLDGEPAYEKGIAKIYRLESVSLVNPDKGYVAIDDFAGTLVERYQTAIHYANNNFKFDVLFIIEPSDSVDHRFKKKRVECGIISLFESKRKRYVHTNS